MGTHNMFSWSNKKGISFFRMMLKKKKKIGIPLLIRSYVKLCIRLYFLSWDLKFSFR